jgi:hypothetical protein
MDSSVFSPLIIVNLALLIYSTGVGSERIAGKLKWRHLAGPLFQPDDLTPF